MRLTRHGQPWLRPGTRPPDVTSPPAVYEPGLYAAEWERLGRLSNPSIHAVPVESGKKDSERR